LPRPKQEACVARFLFLCALTLGGAFAQEADPGLTPRSAKLPGEQWFAIRKGLESVGVARLTSKPLADGFAVGLHAELNLDGERQLLDEQLRVGPKLTLRSLTRSGSVQEGDGKPEGYTVTVARGESAWAVTIKDGDASREAQIPGPVDAVCGLASRLLLPYRLQRGPEPVALVDVQFDELRTERLAARWQVPGEDGTQRLVVGSEEIADTWGFTVAEQGALVEVRTPDGLRWTPEPDEATARKDRTWPADDPRRVVQAFLAAVDAGEWEKVERHVDWDALAASLEVVEGADALREQVRASLGDQHGDEPLSGAELQLRSEGEERLVSADGVRFRLAQREGAWRIVGIDPR